MRRQQEDSAGPPQAVSLLHGFMGCGDDWSTIGQTLERDFRVLSPDLPGHGTAIALPRSNYTMDGATDALARTLDTEGIHQTAIVGYSMGGRLALHFALRHPGRVERLIVLSASPGLQARIERVARRALDQQRAAEIEEDLGGFLERWYRMPLFRWLDDETRKALIEKRSNNIPAELRKSLEGMGTGAQPSHWERLREIRKPAWSIVGAEDSKFVNVARQMAKVSTIKAVVIPGAGHALPQERPVDVASLLRNLLSQ